MARANETESKLVISGEDRTRAMAQSAKKNFSEVENSVLGLRTSMSSLSGIGFGGGLVGAATAIVGSLAIMGKQAADVQDEFYKMSQRVGVSTETLSGWAYAARLADVSQDELGTGLKQLSKNLIAGDEAFTALHITTKNSEEAFLQVADRFAEMEDGAGKTALAMRIFGRSGADLIPMLNLGSAGLREMSEEARSMGLIVGTEAAKAAEAFNDNLTRLSAGFDGFKMTVGNAVIPVLSELVDEFNRGTKEAGGFWEAIRLYGTMNPFKDATTHVRELIEEIEDLERRIPNMKNAAFKARAQGAVEDKRKQLGFQVGQVTQDYEYIDSSSVVETAKKKAPNVLGDGDRAAAAKKAATERIAISKNLQEQEEEFAKDYAEAWKYYTDFINKEKLDAVDREKAAQQAYFDWIGAEQERQIEEDAERQRIDAENKKQDIKDQTDVIREFGLTFNSALEDALVNFENLSDVANSFGKDLVRIAVRKFLTEPIIEAANAWIKAMQTPSAAGGSGGGGGLFGLLGSLMGSGGGEAAGFMPGEYINAFATGTDYVTHDQVALIHKGEKIIPAAQNKGGAGSGFTLHYAPVIDARGADAGIEQRLQRQMRDMAAHLEKTIPAKVQEMNARGRVSFS